MATEITPTITYLEPSKIRLSWTGVDADHWSRIYLNGKLRLTWNFGSDLSRQMDLRLETATETFLARVVESLEGEQVLPYDHPLIRRPIIHWTPVSGTAWYIVYQDNVPAGLARHSGGWKAYDYQVRLDLHHPRGRWYFFRVESKDYADQESSRNPWPHFVPGLPPVVAAASWSGTSPNLQLDLET